MSSLQATDGDDSQQSSSSSSNITTAGEEVYEQPANGSVVNAYIGGPLDAFSRPTQILSGDEVRKHPPTAVAQHVYRFTLWDLTWPQQYLEAG